MPIEMLFVMKGGEGSNYGVVVDENAKENVKFLEMTQ